MTPDKRARLVRREIDQFLREGLISASAHAAIAKRYPLTRWDWRQLSRWFTIFGGLSTAIGASILLSEVISFTVETLAVVLAIAVIGCVVGAHWLKLRGFAMTAQATELVGGLALVGLSFTLRAIYAYDWANWPALLLIDLIVLLIATYLLANVLLLVLSAALFFTWFGGFTGYISGWGVYWFGMNYPLRFLLAAVVIAGIAWLHLVAERGPLAAYRGFFKVWLSSGFFFGEMALWLLSLFGNYGEIFSGRLATGTEIFVFNALWVVTNGFFIYIGARTAIRILIGYGATFLVIQIFTLYFRYVAGQVGPVISVLLVGGSALWLSYWLEMKRRARRALSPSHPRGR